GASGRRLGVVKDILRTRSGKVSVSRPQYLIVHEGTSAPLAGLRIDAALLNEYVRVKHHVGHGGFDYFCSVVGKTLPSYLLWRGGPPPPGIVDFHCDKVAIRFDREIPLQVGGDAEGYRREVIFEMAERPLQLLDLRARG